MPTTNPPDDFSGDSLLSPKELTEILQKVDDDIRRRNELVEGGSFSPEESFLNPPPALILPDLIARINENQDYHAPLYNSQGWSIASIVKKILNIPIKIFARKQQYYNQEILEMLLEINKNVKEFSRCIEYNRQLYSAIIELSQKIDKDAISNKLSTGE